MMPYCKQFPMSGSSHHVLYALNNYRGTFDVLDSFDWASNKSLSRSSFHCDDIKEIVCFLTFTFLLRRFF